MAGASTVNKDEARVLRRLARGSAKVESASAAGAVLLVGVGDGVIAAKAEVIDKLAERGLIVVRQGMASISPAGRQIADGASRQPGSSMSQMREVELTEIAAPEGAIVVPVNVAESPLAMLARRRGKDGKSFLDEIEWRAGERFRSDYTRGQIMPRLGANWVAPVSSGKRGANGSAELTEAALAARFRVEKALEAVGPEMSGVLVDVCCFLKGLELVEAERGWPVRSAKVVLKTALAALARHYDLGSSRGTAKRAHALHWGADGYRPTIR